MRYLDLSRARTPPILGESGDAKQAHVASLPHCQERRKPEDSLAPAVPNCFTTSACSKLEPRGLALKTRYTPGGNLLGEPARARSSGSPSSPGSNLKNRRRVLTISSRARPTVHSREKNK